MVTHPFRVVSFILLALLALSGLSCKKEQVNGVVREVQPEQQVYQVNGVVREVQPERKQVKIEHEKIPNYMAAMTMTFDVRDAKELDGLGPGDKVAFRMIVQKKDGWIDQIKKTGT